MTIQGLDNNYYLSGNNIWIKVNGFTKPTTALEIKVKNIDSQKSYEFSLAPSPEGEYDFNISQPIRGLMPLPNPIQLNTLQNFEIEFKGFLKDADTGAIESVTQTLTKQFIRGWIEKSGSKNWHLQEGNNLFIGKWLNWDGISLVTPKKLLNGEMIDYLPAPTETETKKLRNNCNYTIVKFLNSLGAYQLYVFENSETKFKTKPKKTIEGIAYHLKQNNSHNLGLENEKTIELHTKTSYADQPIIIDLIRSYDVYLFDKNGTDEDGRWQRLKLGSNETIQNTYDRVYENKITFEFFDDVERAL